MGEKLDSGAVLPRVTLNIAGGGEITVPDAFESGYGMLLFYRGHW